MQPPTMLMIYSCVIASILRLYYLVGEFATTKINKANSYGGKQSDC